MAAGEKRKAEEEDELDALWGEEEPRRAVAAPQPQPSSSEEDSYFDGSEAESEDSAARRAREADARLKDLGEVAAGPAPVVLPSAGAAFTHVAGPPSFLDPEATRPLASAVHKGVDHLAPGAAKPAAQNQLLNKRGNAAGEWDISKMAPKVKEEGVQEVGVTKGTAVRYKAEEGGGTISAAQIAMLGGQWSHTGGGGGAAAPAMAPGPGPAPSGRDARGKSTPARGVEDFLAQGVGGAVLPRKRQDRKDREKDKREKGQSTHHVWKSEAEMLLRQTYD